MQTLHGYNFDETQWKTLGGNGQCVKATKGGKEFFIKRLSRPKYPESNNFTSEFKRQKIAECDEWLKTRKAIANTLPGTGSGNIIKPIEYFREGPCFYEIANLVDIASIPYNEIWKESKKDKARMMMTIAMSLAEIHKVGIVHGDLDPGNILISRSAVGYLITKLIDFSDAFFEKDPPKSIMSKDAWWSPEVAMYSKHQNEEPNPFYEYISCKADVFSLGLIFHQYCTKGANFPKHSGDYPWQGFADGGTLEVDESIDPEFRSLISSMIEYDPDDRPNVIEIQIILRKIANGEQSSNKEKESTVPAIEKREVSKQKDEVKANKSGNSISVGSGKTKTGASVVSAKLNERNPKKVEIVFSNGNKQIMDLILAVKQGFVVIEE